MIDGQKFRALGFAILHLTLKENTSLFVAAFGCYLILTRQMRHFGGFLVLLGGLCFIVVMTQIFPYFRHGAESEYFAKYYGYLGHTMAEFVTKAVTQPWIPILEMLKPAKVLYLLTVFSPFALLPLLRPVTLLPIVPSLLIAVLSNIPEMYAASFHYEAEIYPWLFSSTVLIAYDETTTTRIQRVLKLWPQMVRHRPVSIWLGVMTVFFTGASPVWKLFYYAPSKHHLDLGVHLETLRKDLSGCKVASVERIAGHLASVEQLTMLPEHQSADAIVIAYPQGKRLWLTPFHVIEKEYAPMWDQNYKLIQPLDYDRDFRVWVRPPCRFPST